MLLVGLFSIIFVSSAYADSANYSEDENSLIISEIDARELTPSHPYITIKIKNHGAAASTSSQFSLIAREFENPDSLANRPANFNLIQLGSFQIDQIQKNETVHLQIKIDSNHAAKLKKSPYGIMGQLKTQGSDRPLGTSLTFSFLDDTSMVSASALAFDSPHYASGNLASQIDESLKGVFEGSELNQDVLSIVLADDLGVDNTTIHFVYGGKYLPADQLFNGLPDHSGLLNNQINEYDMGDGATLGGYLKWVRSATLNSKLSFSFYGHGGALMPDVELQSPAVIDENGEANFGSGPITLPAWVAVMPAWVAVMPAWVAVMPAWVAVMPAWVAVMPTWVSADENFATDSTPLSLISVKDLAVALKVGSNNGENPLELVDLVHCFSLSIEEVHELAPYSKTIVGSANYHYFDARMPGVALQQLNGERASNEMGTDVMNAYDEVLPQTGYPRTMAVLDAPAVNDIKLYWDKTSVALIDSFEKDQKQTRKKLQDAYSASSKYDSTSCDNEFSLNEPDALVDFYQFASHVGENFDEPGEVSQNARLTAQQIDRAVVSVVNRDGIPWFSQSADDAWAFDGKGVSIYADLMGLQDANGQYALSWQSAFYNREINEYNRDPFSFLASTDGSPTWSDVLAQAWDGHEVYVSGCVITIPPSFDESEISLNEVTLRRGGNQVKGADQRLVAEISIDQPLGNLIVLFEVSRAGDLVYSEAVYTGWIEAGNMEVSPTAFWDEITQGVDGEYTVSVVVDPDAYIQENDKQNNESIFTIIK